MPEFDEETYKRKNRSDQDLSYEPGKNADRYQSKQPGSGKRSQSEGRTTSLWVEAATSTHPNPKGTGDRRSNPKHPSAKGPRRNSRNRRNRGKRKLTLLEKILSFFGIKPKQSRGPQSQQRKRGGKPDNRNQQQQKSQGREGNRNNRARGGNRPGSNQKPRGDSEETTEGGGGNRRRRSRKPRAEREQQEGETNRPERSYERKNQKPRQQNPRREARDSDHQGERREPRSHGEKTRLESIAAPKTEGASIALGAIEMDTAKPAVEKTEGDTAAKQRRGRRRNANQRTADTGKASSGGFVPHPIDLPENSGSSENK
jgi:hypothetical protein